jgi:hypothetical protein
MNNFPMMDASLREEIVIIEKSKLRRVVPKTEEPPLLDETFGCLPGGSKFKIARIAGATPPKNALIFLHGYRPNGIPLAAPFAANDNPHRSVYTDLMQR